MQKQLAISCDLEINAWIADKFTAAELNLQQFQQRKGHHLKSRIYLILIGEKVFDNRIKKKHSIKMDGVIKIGASVNIKRTDGK